MRFSVGIQSLGQVFTNSILFFDVFCVSANKKIGPTGQLPVAVEFDIYAAGHWQPLAAIGHSPQFKPSGTVSMAALGSFHLSFPSWMLNKSGGIFAKLVDLLRSRWPPKKKICGIRCKENYPRNKHPRPCQVAKTGSGPVDTEKTQIETHPDPCMNSYEPT